MPTLTLVTLATLAQVALIDLVLAGDNAVVIGLAASGLPDDIRPRAVAVGIGAAMVVRLVLALIATHLLAFTGLVLAGGALLLWVCWKMWRELREADEADQSGAPSHARPKTLRAAVTQIVIADVSMSLDNVLAVAGAAQHEPVALVVGLVLSVALMGAASMVLANLLNRHRWIGYLGLLLILFVACRMIYEGANTIALRP